MIASLIAPLIIAAGFAQTPDCTRNPQASMCQQQAGHPSIYSGYTGPGDGMQSAGGFGGFGGPPLAQPVFPMS